MSTDNEFSWIDPEEIREHMQGEPREENSSAESAQRQEGQRPSGPSPAGRRSETSPPAQGSGHDAPSHEDFPKAGPAAEAEEKGMGGFPQPSDSPALDPHQSQVVPPWVSQDEEDEDQDVDDFEEDDSDQFEPDYDILAPGDPLDQPPYNRPFRPGDAALANPPGKRPERHEEEEVPGADNPAGDPADPAAQPDTPEDPVPEPRPRKEITPPPPDAAVVNPDPVEDAEEEVPTYEASEAALPLSAAGPEEGLQPEPPDVPPAAEDHPELEEAAPTEQSSAEDIPEHPAEDPAHEQEPDGEPMPSPTPDPATARKPDPVMHAAEPEEPAFEMPEISGRTPEEKLNHLAEWAVEDLGVEQIFVIDGDGNTVVARNATRGVLLAASQMFAAWVHLGQVSQSAADGVLKAHLFEGEKALVILRGGSNRAEGSLGLTLLLKEELDPKIIKALQGVFHGICEEILES